MRMRSARNQKRGCVFLRLLSPTRKTPASIFRRLPRWCNPCESCPMNHWQWDPRSSLRMRLRILLEESFVFACCLLPTPCAKMPFCLSAPAHGWKQPKRNPVPPTLRVLTKIPLRSTDTTPKIAVPIPGSQFISCQQLGLNQQLANLSVAQDQYRSTCCARANLWYQTTISRFKSCLKKAMFFAFFLKKGHVRRATQSAVSKCAKYNEMGKDSTCHGCQQAVPIPE